MKSRYIENFELSELKKMLGDAWLPFEVAYETGLRIGDVLKIKVEDIDQKKGELHYVSQKRSKCGSCKLSKTLIEWLVSNSHGEAFCFPSALSESGHLTRQAAWKRIKKAAQRCGIDADGISPHALRKVFAVNLCREEGIEAVRQALQHERIDTTQIYALSDFSTGANAKLPLLRGDIQLIADMVIQQIRSIENGHQKT